MGCSIQKAYWRINNIPGSITPGTALYCSADRNDTVEAVARVAFDVWTYGNIKAEIKVRLPNDAIFSFFTPLTYIYPVVSGYYDFVVGPLTKPIPGGLYYIEWVAIYDANGNTICDGSGTLSGNCKYLRVTEPIIPPPVTCTMTIRVAEGFGSIKVYDNNVLIDTITGSKTYNMTGTSSSFKFIPVAASGYIFERWCSNEVTSPCVPGTGTERYVTWNSGCQFGNREWRAYFLQEAQTVSLEVKRVGSGKVNVYRNNGYIGTVTETDASKTFSFNRGDTFKLEAFPVGTNTMFEKWCGPAGCTTPYNGVLTGTISSNQTGTYARIAYFTESHNVCENDANTGTGICKKIPGAGTNECQIVGNTCAPNYHNECKPTGIGGTGGYICERIQGEGLNTCTIDQIGKACTPTGGPECLISNPTGGCLLTKATAKNIAIGAGVIIVAYVLVKK